jgi:hypothetical protein
LVGFSVDGEEEFARTVGKKKAAARGRQPEKSCLPDYIFRAETSASAWLRLWLASLLLWLSLP